MRKIRNGDTVAVMAGKSKGRTGKVKDIIAKHINSKRKLNKSAPIELFVVVEGANMITVHQKPNPRLNQKGGRIQREAPIHASNVMLVNPHSGNPERVGIKTLEDGKKVRFFKKSGEVLDV